MSLSKVTKDKKKGSNWTIENFLENADGDVFEHEKGHGLVAGWWKRVQFMLMTDRKVFKIQLEYWCLGL